MSDGRKAKRMLGADSRRQVVEERGQHRLVALAAAAILAGTADTTPQNRSERRALAHAKKRNPGKATR